MQKETGWNRKQFWEWNSLRHFGHKTNLHPSVNNLRKSRDI